jgi:hypothetical protein
MIGVLVSVSSLRKFILQPSPLLRVGFGHDCRIMDNKLENYAVHGDTLILVVTVILDFGPTWLLDPLSTL